MKSRVTKRFKKVKEFCVGEILHLGVNNDEKGENLHNYLKKKLKVFSVDIYGNVDYLQDLNLPDWKINKKFDTVIAPEILEHIRDPLSFIKNCYKLLNKKGRIIITTPNATSLIYLFNPSWCVDYKDRLEKDNSHIHSFTSGMLKFLLKTNGFKILKVEYLNEFLNNPLGLLIAHIFKRLRGDIIIIGEKI